MKKIQAVGLVMVAGAAAAFLYLRARGAHDERQVTASEALALPTPDPDLEIRGFELYVRLVPGRTEETLTAVERAVGSGRNVFQRREWAVVLWDELSAPEDTLRDLSRAAQTEIIWLSFQKQVDAFEFQHWKNGVLERRLTYGCYERERTWEKVEGEPEPWEARALFATESLEREVHQLRVHPPKGRSVARQEAALRAIWRERRLSVGSQTPMIFGRDAAKAVATAYRLPGWD